MHKSSALNWAGGLLFSGIEAKKLFVMARLNSIHAYLAGINIFVISYKIRRMDNLLNFQKI
jgi:hypothetical protein